VRADVLVAGQQRPGEHQPGLGPHQRHRPPGPHPRIGPADPLLGGAVDLDVGGVQVDRRADREQRAAPLRWQRRDTAVDQFGLGGAQPAVRSGPNRRANPRAVVDAGGSATARSCAPATSARIVSKSQKKSPPASMHSARPTSSSPAPAPRRRALTGPTWRSMVPTTSSTRQVSATSTSPPFAVNVGSSGRNSILGRRGATVTTRQVPFLYGTRMVS